LRALLHLVGRQDVFSLEIICLFPVLGEILALDLLEEPSLDFCLRFLMLEADQLQSDFAFIRGRDLHVHQTKALDAVILDLANGYYIS